MFVPVSLLVSHLSMVTIFISIVVCDSIESTNQSSVDFTEDEVLIVDGGGEIRLEPSSTTVVQATTSASSDESFHYGQSDESNSVNILNTDDTSSSSTQEDTRAEVELQDVVVTDEQLYILDKHHLPTMESLNRSPPAQLSMFDSSIGTRDDVQQQTPSPEQHTQHGARDHVQQQHGASVADGGRRRPVPQHKDRRVSSQIDDEEDEFIIRTTSTTPSLRAKSNSMVTTTDVRSYYPIKPEVQTIVEDSTTGGAEEDDKAVIDNELSAVEAENVGRKQYSSLDQQANVPTRTGQQGSSDAAMLQLLQALEGERLRDVRVGLLAATLARLRASFEVIAAELLAVSAAIGDSGLFLGTDQPPGGHRQLRDDADAYVVDDHHGAEGDRSFRAALLRLSGALGKQGGSSSATEEEDKSNGHHRRSATAEIDKLIANLLVYDDIVHGTRRPPPGGASAPQPPPTSPTAESPPLYLVAKTLWDFLLDVLLFIFDVLVWTVLQLFLDRGGVNELRKIAAENRSSGRPSGLPRGSLQSSVTTAGSHLHGLAGFQTAKRAIVFKLQSMVTNPGENSQVTNIGEARGNIDVAVDIYLEKLILAVTFATGTRFLEWYLASQGRDLMCHVIANLVLTLRVLVFVLFLVQDKTGLIPPSSSYSGGVSIEEEDEDFTENEKDGGRYYDQHRDSQLRMLDRMRPSPIKALSQSNVLDDISTSTVTSSIGSTAAVLGGMTSNSVLVGRNSLLEGLEFNESYLEDDFGGTGSPPRFRSPNHEYRQQQHFVASRRPIPPTPPPPSIGRGRAAGPSSYYAPPHPPLPLPYSPPLPSELPEDSIVSQQYGSDLIYHSEGEMSSAPNDPMTRGSLSSTTADKVSIRIEKARRRKRHPPKVSG